MEGYQAAEYQYRLTQLLEAQIELEAMKAANLERSIKNELPIYKKEDFLSLISKHGIHHNAAMEASFNIR